MALIPQNVLDRQPVLEGLKLRSRGKVRDSYDLPDFPEKMLVVASDRISIFDIVLNALIDMKGSVLTALSYFWIAKVLEELFKTDLVECGAYVDKYLPKHLRNNPELQKRAMVVKILPAPDVEDIVRFVLTGSGWESYQKTGMVCGHRLPKDLVNGSLLPFPIYTPTTKATEGHDEHITADSVAKKYGAGRERLALQSATLMANYAASRGIRMADGKEEISLVDGRFVIADEKGTPDCCRFWDEAEYRKALKKGKLPPSFDKQYVREWGKSIGIDKRNPKNPDDVAWVHSQVIPDDVREMTTRIYRYIFWRLTNKTLEQFQKEEMNINVQIPKRNIEVVVGSASDLPQTSVGMDYLVQNANALVSVISCHRNPDVLRNFVRDCLVKTGVVIAGAGEAAALPGIIKSLLCEAGHPEIPVIGVAFKGSSDESDWAATSSIERLPGQPVELDFSGEAYFGESGFFGACVSAVQHEFLPKNIEKKEAHIHIV